MATVLDIGILQNFSIAFSMVLIIAIVYGLLQVTKAFNGGKGLHILIAFIVGLMFILVPDVTRVVSVMMPWFTLLFIFLVFLLMVYKIFGATDADISGVLRNDRTLVWVIIIIAVVIAIGSFSVVYGQRLLKETTPGAAAVPAGASQTGAVAGVPLATATPSFTGNLSATFFHPKVLGVIFLFLVAVFTIAILSMEARAGTAG